MFVNVTRNHKIAPMNLHILYSRVKPPICWLVLGIGCIHSFEQNNPLFLFCVFQSLFSNAMTWCLKSRHWRMSFSQYSSQNVRVMVSGWHFSEGRLFDILQVLTENLNKESKMAVITLHQHTSWIILETRPSTPLFDWPHLQSGIQSL